MSDNVVSQKQIKNRRGPKIVPWGTPHLRPLGVEKLDDKSVFDCLNKMQTIDGWSNKSHSIAIFITKYRDLLYHAFFRSKKTTALTRPRSLSIAQLSVASISAVSVECEDRKPD